jgi:hypothetical protein
MLTSAKIIRTVFDHLSQRSAQRVFRGWVETDKGKRPLVFKG